MLLAIDTSTRIASVALYDGRDVESELTWRSEMNHTVELFPAIEHVLRVAKQDMADLTRLAVATGPGSFNGLRVAVSTSKALSHALGIPLVGISTLEYQAYQHSWYGRPVCSILRAGRDEVASAIFARRNGEWVRLVEEHITTVSDLSAKIAEITVFTGEIDAPLASDIASSIGARALVLPAEARLRRSGFLASLGWELHEAGLVADVTSIQPLYLRRPPITTRHRP